MTKLNDLAVKNADLLRQLALSGDARADTVTEMAARISRDESNVRKSINALDGAGLADAAARTLTQAGVDQLAAIVRAEDDGRDDTSIAPSGVMAVRHDCILPDPDNARRDWDSEDARADLLALAEDIAANGLLQNLVVRLNDRYDGPDSFGAEPQPGDFILVGGERRWRAIDLLIERGDWPADRPIVIRLLDAPDDAAVRLAALAENLQRRNLNPIEEAAAYRGLREAGLTTEQIASRVSLTQRHVQMRLQLLDLTEDQQRRMTLPADDPNRLSVSEARRLVQNLEARLKAREKWEAELTPAQRLILAEMYLAAAGYIYTRFDVDGPAMAADPDAVALEKAGLITIPTGRNSQGQARGGLDSAAHPAVQALFPDAPTAYVEALCADLGLPAPADEAYVTPWLNGPFEIPAAIQAEIEAEAAAAQAQEQERQAERDRLAAEREAAAERGRQAALRAAELTEQARAQQAAAVEPEVFADAASAAEAPLPWRVTATGGVVAADGSPIIHGGNMAVLDRGLARMRLLVLAANGAAGLETPQEEQPPAPDALDEPAFVAAIAGELAPIAANLSQAEVGALAADILADFLAENGVAFGDEGFDWSREGAVVLAGEHLNAADGESGEGED